jgi:hypothetical protein
LEKPSTALYWHIGGTAIRLRSVTPLSLNGVNSATVISFFLAKIYNGPGE